jgi:hypothetical protein
MMKMRTRKAPARRASGTVSHQEMATLRYIKYQRTPYGIKVLASCNKARGVEDS